MHLMNVGKERLYEKNSVDSNNCCDHSHSVRVVINQAKSSISQDKSRSKSRDRGISLTHQSLSLQKLSNPKRKLRIMHNQNKFSPKVDYSMDHTNPKYHLVKTPNDKKPRLVERCVSYKNNRIHQRDCFSKKQSYVYPEVLKRNQDDLSTCKNTPRIQGYSISSESKAEIINKINICTINPQIPPKIDISIIQSKLDEHQKMTQDTKTITKPLFQKWFEEHQGRKIVTIQSNQGHNSEWGEIKDYSVTESFVFSNRLS